MTDSLEHVTIAAAHCRLAWRAALGTLYRSHSEARASLEALARDRNSGFQPIELHDLTNLVTALEHLERIGP